MNGHVVLARIAAFLLALVPLDAVTAQDSEPVHQAATWYGAFIDHAVTSRTSLWFDGQWRRMGTIDEPQQLLLRPGLLFRLTSGARAGAGYAFIASAPYGEAPSAYPLREHRLWQQLVLTHAAGPVSFSHRYRWEQRWLALVVDGATDTFRYGQRARYMVRGQGNLPRARIGGTPVLAFAWNEVLLPVGHADALIRVTQNRAGAGVGMPFGSGQRFELGYMNLWNALGAPRNNEFNHTLTLSYYWTRSSQ